MKKLLSFLLLCGVFVMFSSTANAQDSEPAAQQESAAASDLSSLDALSAAPAAEQPQQAQQPVAAEGGLKVMHQVAKSKFIEGGAGWMTPILIFLIIGLAIGIERIIYLNLATTNTDKLLQNIEKALDEGGIEAAKEVCRNTRGPVASIFYQGFDRSSEDIDAIEKSVISYGGLQMAKMEKGMIWLGLFIALAPSMGFLGTVVGMIMAFDDIQKASDMSPAVVAGGMKVALLTTTFGLIVAMILQLVYNYLLDKIDSLVADMENSSISLMDILVKYKAK